MIDDKHTLKIPNADIMFNNSICWKVEGSSGEPSYIFGSIHQMDTSKIPLPLHDLEQLLDDTQALCIETELGNDASDTENLGQSMMAGGGGNEIDTLHLLGEAYDDKLRQIIKNSATAHDLLPLLERVPLSFITLLVTIEKQQQSELFSEVDFEIEKHFATLAEKRNYSIHALETLDEQMALIADEKPIAEQVSTLKKTIDNYLDPTTHDMFRRYAEQDLRLLRTEDYFAPEMTKRNALMAERLAKLLAKKSLFVIVGAAHLPYETGVLALLQKQRYKITPHTIQLGL